MEYRMANLLNVRPMVYNEIDLLYNQALKENWDPGIYDLHSFYKSSPDSFYVGTLNEKPICFVSIVQYEEHFAFFGNYIVIPEYRHKGFGLELVKNVASRLENRISSLDAVVEQIKTYEKSGFVCDGFNIRYLGTAKKSDTKNTYLENLKNVDFKKICAYDYKHFLAHRTSFLSEWINHPQSFGLAYFKDNKILGYSVLRETSNGYRIAPLFADSVEIAKELMQASLNKIIGKNFTINMPTKNQNLKDIISTFQLEPVFKTMRMYRNGELALPCHNIYSITSFELG